MISVQELEDKHAQAWDAFVLEHPHGSPFHLLAWKRSIEETFGYTPKYLIALDGSGMRGVLPLFIVRNLRLRRIMISSPFAVYGGALADSEEAKAALGRHLERLAQSLRVEYVELRNAYREQCFGFTRLSRYVTLTHPLSSNEGAILKSMRPKARNMARKGINNGLTTRIQTDDFQRFDHLYSTNLQRLGTPRFPPSYFAALLKNFQGQIDIRETLHGDEVVAVAMNLYFRDRVLPYYAASDCGKNHLAPNNFMYFDLMRAAGAAGYQIFDFGRSRKFSGSYEFKRHWGMSENDLPYEVLMVKAGAVPNFSPDNSTLQIGMRIWRRLPSAVTQIVGPRLIRYVA